jgi:hypothetical protein
LIKFYQLGRVSRNHLHYSEVFRPVVLPTFARV